MVKTKGIPVLLGILFIGSLSIAMGVMVGVVGHGFSAYLSLFIITTLGGSIIPVGSPFLVLGGAASGMDRIPLVLIAATGYTAGFLFNYYLAKFLGKGYVEERITTERYETISRWWNRWGLLLLVAFAFIFILPAPILALVCGLFSVRLYYFIPINFAGNLFNSYLLVFLGGGIGDLIRSM
ncbi:MAG: VTT domain-containing protein [Halobacteriota archaeon]|nr:VTT domain-containing protein [Halobacteriota archaeon]